MGIFLQTNVQLIFLSCFLRPAAATRWTRDHDLILLIEILLFEPYSQKRRNPECRNVWKQIAESLNGQREDKIVFKVSQRSVRDRFNVLKISFPKRKAEEEHGSCISHEISEVD